MLRLLTLARCHSAARLLILLLLPCPDRWWPGEGTEAEFTELSRRPLACPFVDCADPFVGCAEEFYQAAQTTHLPASTPATSPHHFVVLIKDGYDTGTTVNTVLFERVLFPLLCVAGSMT